MPSATGNVPFVFTGAKKDEQNDPSTSVVANKRKTFDLQASLKRPKPKYKAYKGIIAIIVIFFLTAKLGKYY